MNFTGCSRGFIGHLVVTSSRWCHAISSIELQLECFLTNAARIVPSVHLQVVLYANACECSIMQTMQQSSVQCSKCNTLQHTVCIIISICIIMHRPDAAASRVSVRPVRCSRLACCPCCRSMSGPSRSSSSAAPQPAAPPLLVEETYIEQGRTCICCTWIAAATPTCEHWSSVLVLPHRFEMQCMRTMCLSRSPTYT